MGVWQRKPLEQQTFREFALIFNNKGKLPRGAEFGAGCLRARSVWSSVGTPPAYAWLQILFFCLLSSSSPAPCCIPASARDGASINLMPDSRSPISITVPTKPVWLGHLFPLPHPRLSSGTRFPCAPAGSSCAGIMPLPLLCWLGGACILLTRLGGSDVPRVTPVSTWKLASQWQKWVRSWESRCPVLSA